MSFNENFVVRNGLEVATNLIYADYISNKVGIGTTTLAQTLTVYGNIGGQNITISGISTVAQQLAVGLAGTVLSASATSGFVGIGTANPQYTLDIRSPVSAGQTALYVKGDTVVTGDLQATNISFTGASVSNLNVSGIFTSGSILASNLNVSGITTLGITSVTNLNVSGITTTSNLNVTGITTVGFITASNSWVSGTSTITTAVITNLTATNLNFTGGITTNTLTDLNVTGITTTQNLKVSGVTTVGFITASNIYVSGLSTFVGIATFNDDLYVANGLNVGSGSTSTFLSDTQFKGYLLTVGNTTSDEIIINSSITSNLIPRLDNTYDIGTSNRRWKSINVGNVEISSGVVTAVSGIVTYYGDGSKLQNVISGVGIATAGGTVGTGVTFLDLRGSGISTVTVSSGIATINIEGGISKINKQSFTVGAAGTNIFTLSQPYTPGYIDVYLNGIRLASEDFTEISSNVIGLTTSAIFGDIVEFQSFSQVVNTATNSNLTNLNVSGITTLSDTSISQLNVSGIVTATGFVGNVTGTATGLSGSPNVTVGNITGAAATFTNLTVNGTQTIINTTELNIADKTVGIASTSTPSDALADGAGIVVYGTTNKTLFYDNTRKGWDFNIPLTTDEVRFYSVAEKLTRSSGNTVSLTYSANGSNVGFATNPTGNITLEVTGIPTSSDFDNHIMTFSVFVNQTGTARSCTAITLNGVSRTIKWSGGSLANATLGVTTSLGYDVYSFTGINTVGSASTTANYEVLGVVNGGYA